MNKNAIKIKIDRLDEQIKIWDEQVLGLVEKADAAAGEAKEKYNKKIDQLQKKITDTKRELNKLKSKLEGGIT